MEGYHSDEVCFDGTGVWVEADRDAFGWRGWLTSSAPRSKDWILVQCVERSPLVE